jgi:hypothetical protein
MLFQREVPVRGTFDICVVGGGPAGMAAAVTAARQGKKVFLAEALGCMGGLGTAGGVPLYMTFSDGVTFWAEGFGREVLNRHGAEGVIHGGANFINRERLKRIYDELLLESGVEFSFFTELVGAERAGDRVTAAVFHGKSGLFAVEAGIFVDASGDGDLSANAGAEAMFGDEHGVVMPSTLCSGWAGIDWEKFRASGDNPRQILFKAFEDGIFRHNDPHHTGINPTGNHLGGGNMGHLFKLNPLDEASLTAGMVEGRRQAVEFQRYYNEYITGYQDAELSFTASIPGIRESRRIVGDYILNLDDYKARASFDDEVGRYCYGIDIHPASTAQADQEEFKRLNFGMHYGRGESYGIPYRSLVVKGLANLLVAGRSVSCDRYIQASIRVMPGCYITGQAAGMAAALAVASGETRAIDIAELRSKLEAFFPQK